MPVLKLSQLRPAVLVALACLMMIGFQAWIEWHARATRIETAEASLTNLASSLAQQADDTIDVADTVLTMLVERIETDGTGPEAIARLDQKLAAQVAAGVRYRSVTVVDAHGASIASSFPDNRTNVSAREFFIHHREDPDRGSYIGHPIQSRETGHWIIPVTRRIQAADGSFAGVAFVSIELAYFDNLYAAYDLGPDSAISLSTLDGTLLARYPPDARLVGHAYPNATGSRYLSEHPFGSFSHAGAGDGRTSLVGYRRSDKYSLLLVAGMSQAYALASWRAETVLHMAMTLGLSLAVGLLGLYLMRQVRRSRRAEDATRKSEAFLAQASRLAGVGGWEMDLATNEIVWSEETALIHGVEPGYQPTLEQGLAFYGPDARPIMAAAVQRGVADGAGWDLELPFIRAGGQPIWVRAVGSAIRSNGKTIRLIGAFQDITDRVARRQELEAANERVALATDCGGIGIWDWDIVSDKIVWDPWMRRLYGLELRDEGLTYAVWQSCLHPDDLASAERAVRDALEGPTPLSVAFRVIWPDGSVHHIRAAAQVKRDAAGTPVRMIGANWDVTALAEQNLQLARANQEAAAAAAQYRLLADNSSDMIVVIDRQHNRSYVSPACRELFGYSPREMIGASPFNVIHPDDAGQIARIFTEMFAGRERAASLQRSRHRDGRWIWVDAVYKLVRDPDTGAPLEICGALRDVTQRVMAEAALRESQERYHLLVESDVFSAVFMLDVAGNVETWNVGAERIKGYTPAEVIGRNFAMFFTPDDVAIGEPAHVLAVARDSGRFSADGWRVRKDGSRFMAHVVINAMRRPDGSLLGFAKVTHDVTARRIEEEQRSIIIEAAPTGMMIVDEAGLITLANSKVEDIFGYLHGTLTGQRVEILVPAAFRTAHAALRSAFTGGRSEKGMAPQRQFIGRRRDGSPVTIEIMLSPVKTPRGRIVVASLFDVTDRVRLAAEREATEMRERLAIEATNDNLDRLSRHLAKARDRADQANRAKSRFLAGMSHELRTPLNGVLGYAQLLHMEGGLTATQSMRVDSMLEAGKHLLQMITRVLDLSEIESEHIELQATEFDVRAVAETCLDLIRPAAEAKRLEVNLVVAPGTPRDLFADATRLRQVLLNLLGNAAKFTSRGSIELRLRPSADGAELRIEVADTGAGVPVEQRGRLFKAFERLDTAATRAAEGAGLGLSLAARLAAMMGGRLGHEDNPGGGSVFWLELPLRVSAATSAPVIDRPDADLPPAPMRPLHVLVVDDVLMNRDIASSFLRSAGHRVICAEGGAEAVALAEITEFDVVLMDVRMPEMDGLEATRRIRMLRGARGRVPIVALTAQAFTEQVAECRAAGMDGHLAKPFEINGLLAAVARAAEAGPRPDGTSDASVAQATASAAGLVATGAAPAPGRSAPAEAGPATRLASTSAVAVAAPARLSPVSELLVLDPKAFEMTAVHLTPDAVASYLRTIAELGDALLGVLRESDALTRTNDEIAAAAHKLAGSAGMFGFQRLAGIGRDFERAVQSGAPDAPALAGALCTAIEDTRLEIRARTA